MPLKSSFLSFLLVPLLGGLVASCEEPCMNAVCSENHELNIILLDSLNQNLILSGAFSSDEVHWVSVQNDTLPGTFNQNAGIISITPELDQSTYTMYVGEAAAVDIDIYQHYAAPPNECCPGFWKIDSVYAHNEKLRKSPDLDGFMLEVD